MCRKPNYIPAEAIENENIVKIALWNGKIFHAGVINVFDNGERLHIARLHKGKVIRREVLTFGYGYGNIRAVSHFNCRYITKGISSDNVLPCPKNGRKYREGIEKISATRGIIRPTSPNKDFLLFKREQERYFSERDRGIKEMTRKIIDFEEKQKMVLKFSSFNYISQKEEAFA